MIAKSGMIVAVNLHYTKRYTVIVSSQKREGAFPDVYAIDDEGFIVCIEKVIKQYSKLSIVIVDSCSWEDDISVLHVEQGVKSEYMRFEDFNMADWVGDLPNGCMVHLHVKKLNMNHEAFLSITGEHELLNLRDTIAEKYEAQELAKIKKIREKL